jgi:hypothetical protein
VLACITNQKQLKQLKRKKPWRHCCNRCCLVLHKMTFFYFIVFCVMCRTHINKDCDQSNVEASFPHSKCQTKQHSTVVLLLCLCGNFYFGIWARFGFQRPKLWSSPRVVSQHLLIIRSFEIRRARSRIKLCRVPHPPLTKTTIDPMWKSAFGTLNVSNQPNTRLVVFLAP